MKDPHDIVIRPVVSEKAYRTSEENSSYTFVVAQSASKPEISDAIEQIFDGVKVSKVNTLNRKGKKFRNRRNNTVSARPTMKKAIITLSEGEIDVFEN